MQDGIANIKGSVTAELLNPLSKAQIKQSRHDVQFNPLLSICTADNKTSHNITGQASFPFVSALQTHAHSLTSHTLSPRQLKITTAAMTAPLVANFELPPGNMHVYYVRSAANLSSSCRFRSLPLFLFLFSVGRGRLLRSE